MYCDAGITSLRSGLEQPAWELLAWQGCVIPLLPVKDAVQTSSLHRTMYCDAGMPSVGPALQYLAGELLREHSHVMP